MNKNHQFNQQTEPNRGLMKLRKYVFTKAWQLVLSHQLYVKIKSRFHAREKSSKATIFESSQIRELHETINF